MKVAVVVMGVLIVAGVAILGVTIVRRVSPGAGPPVAAVLATGSPAVPVLLDEPAGTSVAGMALSGERLALQLRGGGPDRVVVVDLRGGAPVRVGLVR